ncbi:MAG: hypothetical protein J6N18_03965 [Kiritimatiellae bacterium]|nr:hypothetical protein [Kiritimatiellia bacterium]
MKQHTNTVPDAHMITRMNILPHADAGIITKLLRKNRRAASPAVRRSEKAWGMAGPWAESDSLSSAVS